jgi:hypothetical protein
LTARLRACARTRASDSKFADELVVPVALTVLTNARVSQTTV